MVTKIDPQKIAEALKKLDQSLRENSICPICGKPKDGIIPRGMNIEQAGLCTGHDDDSVEEKK